ncbi:MAG: alanine--tRNA ligase [Phycisphaerae bacterium]|nr:alanine--tRNA ligase [Phycisphaerae bacterium]
MLSSKEIRQQFVEFFESKGHTYTPSSSVVPTDDPTLMFTNAGMNQFKDIFLGSATPQSTRAANSQKCIRVSGKHNDLEEVGRDTYHHTFFEMLGNWSFGDYFKKEAISWAWELLTEKWGLDKTKLWATYFEGSEADGVPADEEAAGFWRDLTDINPDQILAFGKKDNFWEMGSVGPCGPCTEIHIDLGPGRCDKGHIKGHQCHVNGECGRYIEIWNLVFIQNSRGEDGKLSFLPSKHVDTGMGLERIVSVMQNKESNYDTDLFMPIIEHIEKLTGKKYTSKLDNNIDNAFRVISDHVRTLTFAIADGATPGNDGRSYILRRILRRAAKYGLELDMHEPFIYKLVQTVIDKMGHVYPEIVQRGKHVAAVIESEETSFNKTLDRGMEIFSNDIKEMETQGRKELQGEKAFMLYDTFGFPIDLTQLLTEEKGYTVDLDGFEQLMDQQRQRARAAQKNVVYVADELAEILPATHDSAKYDVTEKKAKIVGYVADDKFIAQGSLPLGQRIGLILDETCAYAESGGQVGDKGIIKTNGCKFEFDDTRKVGNAILHFGQTKNSINVTDDVMVLIDQTRLDTQRNHTATHLLQWALQKVLGQHVQQEGSLVCEDYLRFDFTHPKALRNEEITEIEDLMREKICEAVPVTFKVMEIEDAKKLGAMALFSEKYGQHVRVLAIGSDNPDQLEDAFSKEFCGGTHVNNTSEIGSFKITKEESVATGIRRITAMTGHGLNKMLLGQAAVVEQLVHLLKAKPEELADRIDTLISDNKNLKKQLQKGVAGDLKTIVEKMLDEADELGGAKIVVGKLPEASVDAIRQQIDFIKKKAGSAVIVFGNSAGEDKVMLIAAVTDDMIGKIKAGDIVKLIAPIVGGGGGGRPQMAQAGGKEPAKLDQALQEAKKFISEKL